MASIHHSNIVFYIFGNVVIGIDLLWGKAILLRNDLSCLRLKLKSLYPAVQSQKCYHLSVGVFRKCGSAFCQNNRIIQIISYHLIRDFIGRIRRKICSNLFIQIHLQGFCRQPEHRLLLICCHHPRRVGILNLSNRSSLCINGLFCLFHWITEFRRRLSVICFCVHIYFLFRYIFKRQFF